MTASAQKKVDSPQLIPDMATHYDRLMESIVEDGKLLFFDDVDLDLLNSRHEGEDESSFLEDMRDNMVSYAKQFLGSRYRSGGKGPKVFDCSGFTSFIFRYFGINLFGSSRSQSSQGEKISISDAQIGDLMFFSGRRGGKRVGHVGMVVGVEDDGTVEFIHASTSKGVVIQSFPDGGYYSKRFLSIRRVL